jgi:ubiquinone biosynthesis protein
MWARMLPQFPRLMHQVLSSDASRRMEYALARIEAAQQRQNRILAALAFAVFLLVVGLLLG